MKNPQLYPGTLLQRYKRFLADIKLDSGEFITAHCPNSGSMMGCKEPGSPVMVSRSDNPKRKHAHTWEMVQVNGTWVGINTMVPNRLVLEEIQKGTINQLSPDPEVTREVRYGNNSRIDILLNSDGRLCYVEVKNVTLVRDRIASFPDAVTSRGTKHLAELTDMVQQGHRAVMFYLVQREDADLFEPAEDIDPVYAESLRIAHDEGVEILVYQARVRPEDISIWRELPYRLDPVQQK